MCILSGCDYLESLKGIGLKKAFKIYARPNLSSDLWTQLRHVINHIRVTLPEVRSYMDKFEEAENTFLYQLVYDPENRRLRPLTEYPEGKTNVDFPHAGDWLDPEKALQTACGNFDLKTDEVIDLITYLIHLSLLRMIVLNFWRQKWIPVSPSQEQSAIL